jgi:hypothetical protein
MGCGVSSARMVVLMGPCRPHTTMVSPSWRTPFTSTTSMVVPSPSMTFTSRTVHCEETGAIFENRVFAYNYSSANKNEEE